MAASRVRHFTATGFLVHGDATLLHWHKKVQEWLPPGGHVEPNEDPVQATLREIKEETGFDVEIVPTQRLLDIPNLEQVHAPHSIMIEDVVDAKHGEHQHIDHIYFTRMVKNAAGNAAGLPDDDDQKPSGSLGTRPAAPDGWHWATLADLQAGKSFPTPNGEEKPPPEDVLKLGEAAIRHVSQIWRAAGGSCHCERYDDVAIVTKTGHLSDSATTHSAKINVARDPAN